MLVERDTPSYASAIYSDLDRRRGIKRAISEEIENNGSIGSLNKGTREAGNSQLVIHLPSRRRIPSFHFRLQNLLFIHMDHQKMVWHPTFARLGKFAYDLDVYR